MEDKELKDLVAVSNYWQPLADSLEDEVEEALERAQALEDPTDSHQTRLDGMAKQFSDTCHLVAD
jgi:predicted  nucleic acid-binding Zn-ribbon protein